MHTHRFLRKHEKQPGLRLRFSLQQLIWIALLAALAIVGWHAKRPYGAIMFAFSAVTVGLCVETAGRCLIGAAAGALVVCSALMLFTFLVTREVDPGCAPPVSATASMMLAAIGSCLGASVQATMARSNFGCWVLTAFAIVAGVMLLLVLNSLFLTLIGR